MASHPPLGVVDVFYATIPIPIPTLDFKPGCPPEPPGIDPTDGLRKLKDFPKKESQRLPQGIRRLGRSDPRVAHSVGAAEHPGAIHAPQFARMFYPAALEPDRDGLILSAGWPSARPVRANRLAPPSVRNLIVKAGVSWNRYPERLETRRVRVELFGAPWRLVGAKDVGIQANDLRRSNV